MKNGGGTPTKSLISHLPIAIENSKWHQFIARTMYYCQVFRYMNHLRWQARFNKFSLSTAFNFLLFSQFSKLYITF